MTRTAAVALLALVTLSAHARDAVEIVCSNVPSQSKAFGAAAGAAGGSSAAILAVGQATGLSVVAHSSGAYILTGSGGYVAGTLGVAITGPAIVGVGLLIGGTAVSVELLCAPRNHPDQVAKVEAAAREFADRTKGLYERAKAAVTPQTTRASVAIKKLAGDVLDYAYGGNNVHLLCDPGPCVPGGR